MSTSIWTGDVSSDWADAGNWSPGGIPDASSDVAITIGDAVASAPIGTVNSITDTYGLSFESAGTKNTVATFLDNTGSLDVDDNGGAGGTILNIGGTLTNSGSLTIGNSALSASDKATAAALDNTGTGKIELTGSSTNLALLDVTGAAGFGVAGTLTGKVNLTGDSAIEFASGEITSLARHAQLHLNGNDAFIEDSADPGSNSALTELASILFGATFDLENGASVTTGALVNNGTINLDTNAGDGGSSLTLTGALTNRRNLTIGNTKLAASLDNKGSLDLIGSSTKQALLNVTGGAGAGVLGGNIELSGDSAIEFASGQITRLAAHAQLNLNGNDAFIEDSSAVKSNSALAGLATIGGGATFQLENGASVSTGALVNDGNVNLDGGGSSLTVMGALTNGAGTTFDLENGASVSTGSQANDGRVDLENGASMSMNGSLVNKGEGSININHGSSMSVNGSIVDDGGVGLNLGYGDGGSSLTVAGTITNNKYLLIGDAGLSASDKITAASLDNTGNLGLQGAGANHALLDVASAAGFGTAGTLTGFVQLYQNCAIEFLNGEITTIAQGATLMLGVGGIPNSAFIEDSTALGSNSALTGLSNISGSLDLNNGASVSAREAVNNSGRISLDGTGSTLSIGGALTNDGAFSITNDTEELAGAVSGVGSFNLSNAHLLFDSSVSAGQTITETGADALVLEQAQNFAATIKGFGTGDTIDATNFHAPPATTYNFVENIAGTGGVLTLQDASLTANILMTGDYSKSSFSLAPDSGTGTLVKFV
jgi:hypothetical protein